MSMRAWVMIIFVASCAGNRPTAESPAPPVPVARAEPCSQPEPCIVDVLPCDAPPTEASVTNGSDTLRLLEVPFSDLPGWRDDAQGEALSAFLASCVQLATLDDDAPIGSGPYAGQARDWRAACDAANAIETQEHAQARAFFEANFKPYAALGDAGPQGKLTGYYVQQLRASRKPSARYAFPLYRRPDDLVAVALSSFVDDGRGRRIWGRLADDKETLVPHLARVDFRKERAGNNDDDVLLWLDSPSDVLLLEIEGSGKALLDDGSTVMVAFAGKNGQSSEGRARSILRAVQKLERRHKSGPWTAREIAQYHTLVDEKASMVFFSIESRQGAIGTQDVILTPRRSLAVDRAVIALSTPIWVDSMAPKSAQGPVEAFRQLLIAQDTGGAIVGTVRGDIYFGADQDAVDMGRRVRQSGRMWLLLPTHLQVNASPVPASMQRAASP